MPVQSKHCGGKVTTFYMAAKLEKLNSKELNSNHERFIDELAPNNSASLVKLNLTREYFGENNYVFYKAVLNKLVLNSPDDATVRYLQDTLRGMNLNAEADAILNPDGDTHICENCKIVNPTQLWKRRMRDVLVVLVALILILAPILGIYIVPKLFNDTEEYSTSSPHLNITLKSNWNESSMPITPDDRIIATTTSAKTIPRKSYTYPDFKFGRGDRVVPDMTSKEFNLQVNNYGDLKPHSTCLHNRYHLGFLDWKPVRDAIFQSDCPNRVTTLSVTGGVSPHELVQMLKGFYNVEHVFLTTLDKFCEILQNMEVVVPLKLDWNSKIKNIVLTDVPPNCENGRLYLSSLTNKVDFEWITRYKVFHKSYDLQDV